jgi:hypothetical protein
MKYTVLETEKGGRYYTSYQENYDGPNKIISHCDTDTEAQFICNETKEVNFNIFISSLPEELQDVAKNILNRI